MTHMADESIRDAVIKPNDTRNYHIQPCCENCKFSRIGYDDFDGEDFCVLRAKVVSEYSPLHEPVYRDIDIKEQYPRFAEQIERCGICDLYMKRVMV